MTSPGDRSERAASTSTSPFRVVALLSAHNEADVIGQVLEHLCRQRVASYLIDDGSTDETAPLAERFRDRGLIGLEHRPRGDLFQWGDLLHRKEALAAQLDADWFIHHDADELRESPWLDLDLHDAIREVDKAGFNAIDFRVFNFRPVDDRFRPGDDLNRAFEYCEPPAAWDRLQIKAWRKGPYRVDLVSSGGHEAAFPDRRVCPLQFVLRHYPIRSPQHGRQKVLVDRNPRFDPVERARGWHVQYADLGRRETFLWDTSDLVRYDPHAIRRDLGLTNRDTAALDGLRRENAECVVRMNQLQAEMQHAAAAAERALSSEREERQRSARMAADQLEQARRDLAAAQQSVVDQQQAASRTMAELHAEISRARAEVRALLGSKSWRLTAPLRAVGRAVQRPSSRPPASSAQSRTPAPVALGDLARHTPISGRWGFDRGQPIDRYYIQRFLEAHRSDVHGRVLEIKDSGYTTGIGGAAVTHADVLDVNDANPRATLVADLARADRLPDGQFDCFILTQTLHIIYDCRAALGHAARLLAPGGVLLCTIPAVSRVSDEDSGLEGGDYWRMTAAAVRRLFGEFFAASDLEVTTHGNVLTCTAFLYGLAAEELSEGDVSYNDPWFPLIHCVRAVKRS